MKNRQLEDTVRFQKIRGSFLTGDLHFHMLKPMYIYSGHEKHTQYKESRFIGNCTWYNYLWFCSVLHFKSCGVRSFICPQLKGDFCHLSI